VAALDVKHEPEAIDEKVLTEPLMNLICRYVSLVPLLHCHGASSVAGTLARISILPKNILPVTSQAGLSPAGGYLKA
jgi:hypothetical protein